MEALVVEAVDEVNETRLLLKKVPYRWLSGFLLQGAMHALVAAVLLRVVRQTLDGAGRVADDSIGLQQTSVGRACFGDRED